MDLFDGLLNKAFGRGFLPPALIINKTSHIIHASPWKKDHGK